MLAALFPDIIGKALVFGYVFIVGICLGSFASAIAERTQKNISWIKNEVGQPARSCCPTCQHQLAWFDLIPLFSWLFLMGRCHYCAAPIGKLYPFIELMGGATILMFVVVITNGFLLVLMVLALPFVLAAFLMALKECKVPHYMLFILGGTYIGTLWCLPTNNWPTVIAALSVPVIYYIMYTNLKYKSLSLSQGLFFSIWGNLIVTFCQMFTLRL